MPAGEGARKPEMNTTAMTIIFVLAIAVGTIYRLRYVGMNPKNLGISLSVAALLLSAWSLLLSHVYAGLPWSWGF